MIELLITALENYCRTGSHEGTLDNPHWVEVQWHIHNDHEGYRIYVGADGIARPVYRGETLQAALAAFHQDTK